MLSELIKILDEAEAGLDHLQLAEALWLAQFNPRIEVLPAISTVPKREETAKQPDPDNPDTTPSPQPQPKPQQTKKLYAGTPKAGLATVPARAVPVPDVSALPDALEIGRAMRPLRRRTASRWDLRLDEEATAEASAEASSLHFTNVVPVMRPAKVRWFDLELIVEQSASMIVWQDVAQEFRRLMEHIGAFGDVRQWTLFRREGQARLRDAAGREHSPRQLCDSASRRLMMIFSDGSSRGWMDGAYARAVAEWSENSTVVLLQPLGERLWNRTLVGEAATEIVSPEPGAANSQLKQSLSWWDDPKNSRIVLPVTSLKPEMIERWARMVALPGNGFRAAMLDVPLPAKPKPKLEPPPEQPIAAQRKRAGMLWQLREKLFPNSAVEPFKPEPPRPEPVKTVSAAELVQAFRAMASDEAFDLAVYLSLMPLTPQIMRITQRAMFRAPQLEHLAEFLLGGLISARTTGQAGSLSDIEFEFRPGVRRELLPAIRRSEIEQLVRNAVSDLIGQHIGSVREFIALILDPKGKERLPVAETYAQFFAEITLSALRHLGYEVDAGDEAGAVETQIPMPLGTDGSPSPITPVSFSFRTVRLKPDGTIRKLDTGHAWQFTEMLDGTPLEMVLVPSGKFLMGAPSSEKNSYDDERPQHEVSVPPFYIGKFTITQAQWRTVAAWPKVRIVLDPEPSVFTGDKRPVEQITWHEAREFCARLTKRTGRLYRLPTEAEWEYACRAGTTTPFAFGETITNKVVNYASEYPYGKGPKEKSRDETLDVGSLGAANDFGLFDMHGNVLEWCEDAWQNSYNNAPGDGSAWLSDEGSSSDRVVRGGPWGYIGRHCRSAFRGSLDPGSSNDDLGFRVVVAARSS